MFGRLYLVKKKSTKQKEQEKRDVWTEQKNNMCNKDK